MFKFNFNIKRSIFIIFLFIVYIVVFCNIFFAKGIFINGEFYKKSANLTTVTYSSYSLNCTFDVIKLEKQLSKSIIKIDDKYSFELENGVCSPTSLPENITCDDLINIASQQNETTFKLGTKHWQIPIIIFAVLFLLKFNSTKIYYILNKNKAPKENYYKITDIVFYTVSALILIYFIIPV